MKTEIKEGQNIFDAILGKGGSVELGLEKLINANAPDELNWDVETGDLINTGIEDKLDFVVLSVYKRHSFTPTNGIKPSDDFNGDFNDDFNSGGGANGAVGTGQIGLSFVVG